MHELQCFDAYSAQRQKKPILLHSLPNLPWQKVSQDIFYLCGKNYLVSVDHYSDFMELGELSDSSSESVVQAFKGQFARHGIPQVVVTDNGPAFASKAYAIFSKAYEFCHVTSSPYYSQGNGRAEAVVKSVKMLLKKAEDLWLALLDHRNTPPEGLASSPAQQLMSRRTHTLLPTVSHLLQLKLVTEDVQASLQKKREIVRKVTTKVDEVHAMPSPPTSKSSPEPASVVRCSAHVSKKPDYYRS